MVLQREFQGWHSCVAQPSIIKLIANEDVLFRLLQVMLLFIV